MTNYLENATKLQPKMSPSCSFLAWAWGAKCQALSDKSQGKGRERVCAGGGRGRGRVVWRGLSQIQFPQHNNA